MSKVKIYGKAKCEQIFETLNQKAIFIKNPIIKAIRHNKLIETKIIKD